MIPRPFALRATTIDDCAAICALLSISYTTLLKAHYSAINLAAALPIMSQAQPKLLMSGTFYVAVTEDERLLGCGGWTIEAPGNGKVKADTGHIRHFATHPDALRRGVGKAIMTRCEMDARAAGVTQFECLSSLQAKPFYVSQGFHAVAHNTVLLAGRVSFPVSDMRRSLDLSSGPD
jgi:N-acetylglutamate synthase-like GNAT family acetyltransferase